MARSPQVSIEGLKELQREVRALKDKEVNAAMKEANANVAGIVVEDASPHVPRRTGRLASSLGVKRDRLWATVKLGSRARVPYAPVIHWGWPKRGIKPQPVLSKAIVKRRKDIVETYVREVGKVLDLINAKKGL